MRISSPFITFILFLFCVILPPQLLIAQGVVGDAAKEYKRLFDNGDGAFAKLDRLSALKYYTEAENLATKNQLKLELLQVKNKIGMVYSGLSNYGEALNYYKQAIDIGHDLKHEEFVARINLNIGALYFAKKDYENALNYYNKSHESYKLSNYFKVGLAVNTADLYLKIGKPQEAIKSLLEVRDLQMADELKQSWNNNYAHALVEIGKVDEAQKIIQQLLLEVKPTDDIVYPELINLKAKIKSTQKDFQEAIRLLRKGLEVTRKMEYRILLYNHLSELYFKNNEFEKCKQYKDSVILAKDSLSVLMNNDLFESNRVKLNIQEYQNQMLINQERQDTERKFYIIAGIFGLILFFFIYRTLKNKISKQKQNEELSLIRQKNSDMELESIKNNLAERNRKISAKALYLSGRNELIDETINALSKIPQVTSNKEVNDYLKTLKGYLKTDKEWDEFITYFEQVNPEFLKNISNKHPELSTSDLRYICYVYMNLDTKEISNVFNITYNASLKRKIRIKEKVGLHNDESLYDYLLKISNP